MLFIMVPLLKKQNNTTNKQTIQLNILLPTTQRTRSVWLLVIVNYCDIFIILLSKIEKFSISEISFQFFVLTNSTTSAFFVAVAVAACYSLSAEDAGSSQRWGQARIVGPAAPVAYAVSRGLPLPYAACSI